MDLPSEVVRYVQQHERLPEGYVMASLVLTRREAEELRRDAQRGTVNQTVMSLIRRRAGLPETPHGMKTAMGLRRRRPPPPKRPTIRIKRGHVIF